MKILSYIVPKGMLPLIKIFTDGFEPKTLKVGCPYKLPGDQFSGNNPTTS